MLTKLTGGRIYDPVQGLNGAVKDLYIRDGRVAAPPQADARIDREYDLRGKIVMSGAIDIHTHIGGGKVNLARAMLSEDARFDASASDPADDAAVGRALLPTAAAGRRYAEMGYTTCFDPAVVPVSARQVHLEMADTPVIDTGGYAVLGNDDLLLKLLHEGAEQPVINDYVAWVLRATQCIGVKVINAGGINAFKFNARKLDVDERTPYYDVRPRDIIRALTRATTELGIPFPVHIHASNLGAAGNIESTLATMDAAEGCPVHLTHVQYHSYGTEGKRGFSSAAPQVAAAVNGRENISVDVGQIMFGQTVTLSADVMQQYKQRGYAHPNKWLSMDIECESGCGVVPLRYRDKNFVNALQWAIGLEIFLLVEDPWRVCLTTDHPNGASFTSYPHLIRLLMDKSFRADMLAKIHKGAAAMSQLGGLAREYSLYEIAIMTRAAPARLLGLEDKGHLSVGAAADVTVYQPQDDWEKVFTSPAFVFKDGEVVVKDGRLVEWRRGRTQVVRPEYDPGIERRIKTWFDDFHTISMGNYRISDDEMAQAIGSETVVHPCKTTR